MPNIPRRANFFWGNHSLPWLRALTLITFRKYNPRMKMFLYAADDIDYADLLRELCVIRLPIPTSSLPYNAQSDILSYEILEQYGGYYFDMDIIFLKPWPKFKDTTILVSWGDDYGKDQCTSIAAMGSVKGGGFFQDIMDNCPSTVVSSDDHSCGVPLWRLLYDSFDEVRDKFPDQQFHNLKLHLIAPHNAYHIPELFEGEFPVPNDEVLGVHWYGGDRLSLEYEQLWTADNYTSHPCYLTGAIRWAMK